MNELSAQVSQVRLDSRSGIPCRFFAQGRCRNGVGCPFSHTKDKTDIEPTGASTTDSWRSKYGFNTEPSADARFRIPCQFFLRSSCLKGDKCPFSHGMPQNVPVAKSQVDEDSIQKSWNRYLKGALVSFGDGAAVTKVSLPSDFSAVHISQLPPHTARDSVASLLASLGFVITEDCVRIRPTHDKTSCTADVKVEDPHFAGSLCKWLAAENHDALEVAPISISMPQMEDHARVDSKKVHCSWHKATMTAWLSYGKKDVATKVHSNFSEGIYKVLGQKVGICSITGRVVIADAEDWTVRLSDVSASDEISHITDDIPAELHPLHVSLGPFSHDADLPTMNDSINELLRELGLLEWWQGAKDTAGKRFKAKARFVDEADAVLAVNLLNRCYLPFSEHGRLTVQLVQSVRLKVSVAVFDAAQQEIDSEKRIWAKQHLLYVAYPPSKGFRILKIEGEDSNNVAAAKAALEKALSGEAVKADNGEFVWSKSFAFNGSAYQSLKQLERDLDIFIIRDKRKCQLRLLGHHHRRGEARRKLIDLANQDVCTVFEIELDAKQCLWALKGGYSTIAAAIGRDKVAMGITSHTRRILVTGSDADFDTAQQIFHGKKVALKPDQGSMDSTSDCAICWTEAEYPVVSSCNHIYCAGCFEDMCFAGASSTAVGSGVGIQCQGDNGTCNQPLQLADLEANLASTTLEDILEAAFKTYIDRHLTDFHYCPTADCDQIYRPAASPDQGSVFVCQQCLVIICTACHISHDDLTCEEYRDAASGGLKALQQAKDELGIRDCPNCSTMMEKAFGCNHMTCLTCGTHFCWVCMKTFPDGDLVYTHMMREHSRIGDGMEYFPDLV